MTTTTPNMSLVLPDVLSTVGPTWATLLNAAYTLIDSHNHSTGQGVAITPSGLNISSDLTFASNNATNLRSARLYNNLSISLGVNDRTCLYALNGELYYGDAAGNTVQVTSGGTLNLAGGVSSLTLNDSAFILQYFGDTSRKFRFSAASIPASTTRIFTLPDNGTGNSTLVSIDATQTLTNKTFDSTSTATGIKIASLTSDGSHTLTFPTSTDTLVGKATTDTLTNKIISGNTAATLKPDGVAVLTLPVATDTLVGKATTDVLTNKTLTGNTAVNLISGGGTIVHNTSGTITVPNGTDTLVGKATTDILSNKSVTGPLIMLADTGIQFNNTANTFSTTVKAVSGLSSNQTITWPSAAPTINYYLQSSDTAGTLQWAASSVAAATSTTAGTITRENVWTAYTPTYTSFGTVSATNVFYKILGDSMFIRGNFTSGTPTAAVCSITIPATYSINGGKIPSTAVGSNAPIVGSFGFSSASGNVLVNYATSAFVIYFSNISGANYVIQAVNGSTLAGGATYFAFTCEVPIT